MNNQEFYGIRINKKIPKLKDNKNINKYYGSIKPSFEGKAYIIEDCKEKQELTSNRRYRKKGKHTIKYINSKHENYFIDIEIKSLKILWLFLFLLILLFLIISQIKMPEKDSNEYNISESIDFDVNLEGNKYVFDINYGDTDYKNVSLTSNSNDSKYIYPGTSGVFYIKISTKKGNKDMIYSMQIRDESNKPQLLKFEIDGKTYNSMEELSKHINGTMKKGTSKVLKINWSWNYENGDGDQFDTNDGEILDNYKVLMRIIGQSKEV